MNQILGQGPNIDIGMYDYNQDGYIDMNDMGAMFGLGMTSEQIGALINDPSGFGWLADYLSQMYNMYNPFFTGGTAINSPDSVSIDYLQSLVQPTQAPQEFAGGGGMGGQFARQLYYPGDSGFAGTGSGIGGSSNFLQQLLGGLGG